MKPHIIFTGGGSSGHVTPNLALIKAAEEDGWKVSYIGSKKGIEADIIKACEIPFYGISTGKLRRYFSWKNFLDPFRIIFGIAQSYYILHKTKASILFSKGGFVAFPVVFAAWVKRIPIIAHESDLSPGLANRLSFPFVNKICLTFETAQQFFKNQHNTIVTGTPIRTELLTGSKQKGLEICGFSAEKPCILVMGGGLGAVPLNDIIQKNLPLLLKKYAIIHLCGKGKMSSLHPQQDYFPLEYADAELPDLLAAADIIISRAGANSLYEILALKKPHILIPLSHKVSRGDQIQNARFFENLKISVVIEEEALNTECLFSALEQVACEKKAIIEKMEALHIISATEKIMDILRKQLGLVG